MKRYTTAQAISILSKPGREGWYAVTTDRRWLFREKMLTNETGFLFYHSTGGRFGGVTWIRSRGVGKRPDWRIIKPKREKLRRIGTTAAPFDLSKTIHLLESSDHEYEIFARRVGK